MCYRTRYALKGVAVIKEYSLFRHCSYQKLGDLSTTLEMTVHRQLFFYKEGRPSQEILRYALNDRTGLEKTIF